ncbi:MAG: SLC13 family permease [Candidatus Accumulibacter sp.]|jgi:anion transporter|nr:SLC13 family permease [Accumulibacter sp.]
MDISPSTLTLLVLAVMAVFFVTELVPLAVTAMAGAVVLGLLGVIKTNQVFTGLANSTVVLFAAMFVIGSAMFHTGLAQFIGTRVVKACGTKEVPLMVGVGLVTAALSSVSSNTGTCAALMPVIIAVCASAGIPAARQLMPLAFAAGAGGTITLVGTPPNIIGNSALSAANFPTFGFFEFAKIGIPVTFVAIVYMVLVGRHLLPKSSLSEADALKAAEAHKGEAVAKTNDPRKMWITGITLIGVVFVMALEGPIKKMGIGMSLEMAATIGAIILVLTGCLTEQEAYRGIDWVTIFLFAGMMPVATAMDKSGAGKMIADTVVGMMGQNPSPYVLTAVLFIISAVLTQFMSNTASAALLCPLGISIANGIGVSPHAVIMAIAIAASCAFATPVGTPPNTLVLGAGGYRFMDYVKCGLPLVLLEWIVCVALIPMIWPFR